MCTVARGMSSPVADFSRIVTCSLTFSLTSTRRQTAAMENTQLMQGRGEGNVRQFTKNIHLFILVVNDSARCPLRLARVWRQTVLVGAGLCRI